MQKNYGLKFTGIGSSLPSKTVKNTDLEKLFNTSDEWIYTRTGIKERRVISAGESGLSLSLDASLQALSQAKLDPKEIDLIIACTTTPDKLYPSMGCMLQGKLGAVNAVSFDLSAACSGFIFGLVTASQFIYSGQFSNILIVGVDIHSRFLDWSDRSVSILFGDGAGALVISSCLARDDELLSFSIKSRSDENLDLVLGNENTIYPECKKSIHPNFVRMNGKSVYEFVVRVVPEIVKHLLDRVNLKVNQIDYFIPHQANQRIINAIAKKIGFTDSQIISNIEKVGNTSAASIPIAIAESLTSKKIKTPCKMLLVGFGAGLTWGGAIVNIKQKLD